MLFFVISKADFLKGFLPKRTVITAMSIAVFSVFLFVSGPARAQQEMQNGPNVFEMSTLYQLRQGAMLMVRQGQLEKATKLLRRIIDSFPQMASNHYFLATVMVRQNKLDTAFDRLTIAIRRGFSNTNLLQSDPALEPLRRQKRFRSLLEMIDGNTGTAAGKSVRKVSPAKVVERTARVTEQNTLWDPKYNILKSLFQFDKDGSEQLEVQSGAGAIKELNDWYSKGLAAGNLGDLYDNHDRNHSYLPTAFFPQLTYVKYGSTARKAGVDYGLNTKMFFNAITVGNSSTVADGRSQARHGLTLPGIPEILFLQYANNHIYIYPGHQDYDAKRGDRMPANTPYILNSKGASSSDRPFIRAVLSILAAFKPEVKNYLRKSRLVMPTVQMVLRRGMSPVKTIADYLSAKAHPVVFAAENIDLTRMVRMANRLEIEDILPMVRLKVLEESGPKPGIDSFTTGLSEILFNTPSAIARVVRASAYEKRMVVRIEKSALTDGKNLTYHWVVLSGDSDRIKIKPRNNEASEVELLIPWHERRPVVGAPEMMTDRVDIGVFVSRGNNFSAPAFISFLYPANQRREYNAQGQILSIDHNDPKIAKRYQEPRLIVRRDWKDIYKYDSNSKLIGWQRRRNKWISNFTRDGAKITQWDELDRPTQARAVDYNLEFSQKNSLTMTEKAGRNVLKYRYENDQDLIGQVIRD